MLETLAQGLAAQAAERSKLSAVLPSVLFWMAGLASIAAHARGSYGLIDFTRWQSEVNWAWSPREFLALDGNEQAVIVLVGAVAVGIAARAARGLALEVVQFFEGYWPPVLRPICRWKVRRIENEFAKAHARREELLETYETHDGREHDEYLALDEWLETSIPKRGVMPTKLGNVLKAAEESPWQKYGLNTLTCWPRLWLIAPETTRSEIIEARERLNISAAAMLLSAGMSIWTIWAWWMLPVALACAHVCYRAMVRAATTYGELLNAAFDVHRHALYEALRWPVDPERDDECDRGQALTQFLWRGPAIDI